MAPCLSKFLSISSKSPNAPEPGAAAPAKPEYTLPLASIAANKPSVPLISEPFAPVGPNPVPKVPALSSFTPST